MQPYNILEPKDIATHITEYCNLYNASPAKLAELKTELAAATEHLDWLIANPA